MAVSGSYDFSVNRDSIIKKSLQIIGVLAETQEPTDTQYTDAALSLNMLIKSYTNQGLLDWNYRTFVLFLEEGVARYDLSSSTSRHWTSEDNLVYSTLSTDAPSSSTSIELVSLSGSAFNTQSIDMEWNIGIRLDDGTLQWTTVNTLGGGTIVNLNAALTGSASSGNRIYAYNTTAPIPEKILNITRRNDSDHDVPLHRKSLKDYQWLTRKTQEGIPVEFSYQHTRTNTKLYTWPAASNDKYRLYIMATQYYDDLDDTGDEPDIPQEWYLALAFDLASILAIEYGVDVEHLRDINRKAARFKQDAIDASYEGSYVKFEPDLRGNREY